jgi:hypothetical protein
LLPTSKATWLLIVAAVATLAFALASFVLDRSGREVVAPFLAAGAWLFGAFLKADIVSRPSDWAHDGISAAAMSSL